jgi:hypothetical protein
MIIGYGFQDIHINEIIRYSIGSGLKIFVIDPQGVDILPAQPVTCPRRRLLRQQSAAERDKSPVRR